MANDRIKEQTVRFGSSLGNCFRADKKLWLMLATVSFRLDTNILPPASASREFRPNNTHLVDSNIPAALVLSRQPQRTLRRLALRELPLKKLSNISFSDVIMPKQTAMRPVTSQAVSRTTPQREEATANKQSITVEKAGNEESKQAPFSREIKEEMMDTISTSTASDCFS